MAPIIMTSIDDIDNNIRANDVSNLVLLVLSWSTYKYIGIYAGNNLFKGYRTGNIYTIVDWTGEFNRRECDFIDFIKSYFLCWQSSGYYPELIIIRNPSDIQNIINAYDIRNIPMLAAIKSKFITEKNITRSNHQTSESGGWVTLEA